MNKAKLDQMSVQIAGVAFLVSFLSSGFAVYQWWTSGQDEKIRATIEISNKFNDDAIDPRAVVNSYNLAVNQWSTGFMNRLDLAKMDAPIKIRKYLIKKK